MSLEATCLCGLSRMHMQQGPAASASSLLALAGTGAQGKLSIMRSFFLLLFSLLLVSHGSSAVITGVSGRKQVDACRGSGRLAAWECSPRVLAFQNCYFQKKKCFAWCAQLNIFLGLKRKIFNTRKSESDCFQHFTQRILVFNLT